MITPPTSSSLNARQAPARSLVKTPVWSPNMLSLTWAMASSIVRNGAATTSGANASFEHTWARRRDVGQDRRREERPVRPTAGEDRATERDRLVDPALRARRLRSRRPSGPTSVAGSSGSPSLRAFAPSTNRAMNASQTSSWMNARWTLMHTWPAYAKPPIEDPLDRPVEVRGLVDDDPGIAAELEHDLLLAGALLHPPADARAAGEGEQLEPLVGDHPVTELTGHRQDADAAPRARPRPR